MTSPAPSGIMIDKATTLDRDDAIWALPAPGGGWDLTVHVALAADTVPAGSADDQRARRRAESVYLPDGKTIPMLPRRAEEAATLAPGRECPVLSIAWHLSPGGAVTGQSVGEGRTRGLHAMTYEEASAAAASPRHPRHQALAAAAAAAQLMLARRRDSGALAIYDLITGMASDGDGGLRPLSPGERHASYVTVSEFMVQANAILAGWCVENDVPVPFRVHQAAAAASARHDLLSDLTLATDGQAEQWRRDGARTRLAGMIRPAVYAPRAGEHFGLRLPWYLHGTSPLRRYPDLVVQRQALARLRGQPLPHGTAELEDITAHVTRIRRERRDRRTARHDAGKRAALDAAVTGNGHASLPPAEFGKVLRNAAAEGRHSAALDAELTRRAAEGILQPGDAYHVLFTATGPRWDSARAVTARWLAESPEYAVSVAAMLAVSRGMVTVEWDEKPAGTIRQPWFSARAGVDGGNGARTWSPERAAPAKNAARQQAALSLVLTLAGQPDLSVTRPAPAPEPAGATTPAGPGRNPVSVVNEQIQARALRQVNWDFSGTGPSHAPSFTCTVTAVADNGTPLEETGAGRTKQDAKADAAARLLQALAPVAG